MQNPLYERLSDDYRKQIDRIREYAAAKEKEIAQRFPNFTLHDARHFDHVASNAAKLLEPVALSEENRFALLAACYLHDIGMANGAAQRSLFWIDREEARKRHAVLSAQDILNSSEVPRECIRDEGLRLAVARISEGHGRWDWDNPYFDQRHGIEIRFCTAILSLADALDLRNGRRNPDRYDTVEALLAAQALENDVSRVHWLRHYYSSAPSIQAKGARKVRIDLQAQVGVMRGPDGQPVREENDEPVLDVRADVIREIIQGDVVEVLDHPLFREITADFLSIELARGPDGRARVDTTYSYGAFLFPARLVRAAFEGGLIKPASVELRTANEYYETRIEPFFAADDFQVSVAWRPGSLSPQDYTTQSRAQSEHVRKVKEVARTHWDVVLWPYEPYVRYLDRELVRKGETEQARRRIAHLVDAPDLIGGGELKRVFLPEEGYSDPVTATRFIAKEGRYDGIYPTASTFRGGAVHRRNAEQKRIFSSLCQRAAEKAGLGWSDPEELGTQLAGCCRTDFGYRHSLATVATILDRLHRSLPAGAGGPELRSFLDASRAFIAAKIAVDEVRDGEIRMRMARLTPERLDEVLRMEGSSFKYAWTSRERFGEYIDGRRAFALFSGDELVGYLLVAFRDDVVDLDKMAVSPLHRHQGFGRFTMRWVERYAAELGRRAVFLRVRESNREAISLYESEGFAVVERKEGYYHRTDNEAALEMEKAVSAP
ncbi:MAG: GNAT family N-acetyltransferase [Gemmatimonadota bacterium]